MQKLHRLSNLRGPARPTFFDRTELNQLLSLYSHRVAAGEWRDYAIDHHQDTAIFSVFRHTLDSPAFSITKRLDRSGRADRYEVHAAGSRLTRSKTLAEARSVFERRLKVVS